MRDLLVRLGKRVHDLRMAKQWSQEEFAHVSGFHRTYVGQIERGEKNLSFGNLLKLAEVFGLTVAQLLAGLQDGSASPESEQVVGKKDGGLAHQMFEVQRLARRLAVQAAAMDRTVVALEAFTASGRSAAVKPSPNKSRSRTGKR